MKKKLLISVLLSLLIPVTACTQKRQSEPVENVLHTQESSQKKKRVTLNMMIKKLETSIWQNAITN